MGQLDVEHVVEQVSLTVSLDYLLVGLLQLSAEAECSVAVVVEGFSDCHAVDYLVGILLLAGLLLGLEPGPPSPPVHLLLNYLGRF